MLNTPINISNVQLYNQTGEDALSLEPLQNKWELFGHVLRSSPETPAQKSMTYYLKNRSQRNFAEDPIITLPTLHSDMIMLKKYIKQECKYNITQLKSIDDLETLRLLAKNRKTWGTLMEDVYDGKAEKN